MRRAVERSDTADDITQKHASQRDASLRRLLNGRAGAFSGIPSGCRSFFQPFPVVSLALNHRLKASLPPASEPSPSASLPTGIARVGCALRGPCMSGTDTLYENCALRGQTLCMPVAGCSFKFLDD